MIAVLYCRNDSIYKTIIGLDCYDSNRDARTYEGGNPVIAHPPCRAWGRLRHFAKPRSDEKALAYHALEIVRRNGGVLEHPASSTLWKDAGMPRPGQFPDEFGGYTIAIQQVDFGHRALKPTWLYVVGVKSQNIPPMPPRRKPQTTVERMARAEREHTPREFAEWLVQLAQLVETNKPGGR